MIGAPWLWEIHERSRKKVDDMSQIMDAEKIVYLEEIKSKLNPNMGVTETSLEFPWENPN